MKTVKIAEFWTPTPQDVRNKGSKILNLPPVRNCFTLVMTNEFVVIIVSKCLKLRKFSCMKWNFFYQITAVSRTSDQGATAPRSPFSLSSVLIWICWTPPQQNSWVRHCLNVSSWDLACPRTQRVEGTAHNRNIGLRTCDKPNPVLCKCCTNTETRSHLLRWRNVTSANDLWQIGAAVFGKVAARTLQLHSPHLHILRH